jgi:4,5-dihydroxyphthalate decarboxylase
VKKPEDLKGKRVGVPEYQMTAPVWIRGVLSDEHGVKVTDYEHLSGGEEEPGRIDKLKIDLPPSIRARPIGPTQTLSQMLADGELDALVTARAPSTFQTRPKDVARLFPDYVSAEKDYFRRTKIFPIMHTVVIRRDVYEKNRWIAQSLYKALSEAKARAFALYDQAAALPGMLPWTVAHAEETRREMGADWWPYGLEPNRHVLDTFLRYHHEQGLSKRRLTPEELFAPETLSSFKV